MDIEEGLVPLVALPSFRLLNEAHTSATSGGHCDVLGNPPHHFFLPSWLTFPGHLRVAVLSLRSGSTGADEGRRLLLIIITIIAGIGWDGGAVSKVVERTSPGW